MLDQQSQLDRLTALAPGLKAIEFDESHMVAWSEHGYLAGLLHDVSGLQPAHNRPRWGAYLTNTNSGQSVRTAAHTPDGALYALERHLAGDDMLTSQVTPIRGNVWLELIEGSRISPGGIELVNENAETIRARVLATGPGYGVEPLPVSVGDTVLMTRTDWIIGQQVNPPDGAQRVIDCDRIMGVEIC